MTYCLLMQSSNTTMPFNEDELNQLDRLDVNAFDRPVIYYWDTQAQKASDILRTGSNARISFFSEHTSIPAALSFYFAKVMNDYHPNMKLGFKIALWSFEAAIPETTRNLWVKGRRHFPTDVISSLAIGAFVGWLIRELHKKKYAKKKLSITPIYNLDNKGIYISYRF